MLVFLLVLAPVLTYAIVGYLPVVGWSWEYWQGWPRVYLEREVTYARSGAWYLWRGIVHFWPWDFAIDVGTSLAVAAGAALLWHLHTAHKHWWHFSLKEMFGLVTASAVALAYCYAPEFQHRQQEAIVARLEKKGWAVSEAIERGPQWTLRPLVDLGILDPEDFTYPHVISWQGVWKNGSTTAYSKVADETINEGMDEATRLLSQLRECDEIAVRGSVLNDEGMKTLCTKWKGCRHADFSGSVYFTDQGLETLIETWPDLEELRLGGTAITDKGMLATARLQHLETLDIDGGQEITFEAAMKLIGESKSLKTFCVPSIWQHPTFKNPQLATKSCSNRPGCTA